jgi:hypothetical protein
MKNQFETGDSVIISRNVNKVREAGSGIDYGYLDDLIGRRAKITGFNSINKHGEACWFLDFEMGGKPFSVCEANLDMA